MGNTPDKPHTALLVKDSEERFVTRYITDMTTTAAGAARDVAKYQHAVPARNRTYRVAIGAAATVVVCWMAFNKLNGEGLAKVLVAAIVALGGVFVVREWKKKKE